MRFFIGQTRVFIGQKKARADTLWPRFGGKRTHVDALTRVLPEAARASKLVAVASCGAPFFTRRRRAFIGLELSLCHMTSHVWLIALELLRQPSHN